MGEAKSRMARADALLKHWQSVSKLLAHKLDRAGLSTNITVEDQKAYEKAWPNGEMHCRIHPDGEVELKLMTRQEALQIEERTRREANRRLNG